MQRKQKEALVESLVETFEEVNALIVVRQGGLTVAEITDLRRRMRAAGAGFKVTKNRLVKRALDGTRFAGATELFNGPTAIAFSLDAVAAAKVAVEYANQNQKLGIVGGALGEQILDADGVQQLAKLPSLDELRGKLAGLIQAPASQVVGVLPAPAEQVARVVGAPGGQLARVFAAYGAKNA